MYCKKFYVTCFSGQHLQSIVLDWFPLYNMIIGMYICKVSQNMASVETDLEASYLVTCVYIASMHPRRQRNKINRGHSSTRIKFNVCITKVKSQVDVLYEM